MSNKKPTPQTPEEWAQWRKQMAYEKAEDAKALAVEVTQEAYTPTETREASAWNSLTKAEVESEWESLRRYAIIRFPEGSAFSTMSPNNRLVGVAHCMGWTANKISAGSGIPLSTVKSWLKRPDVKQFMEEFQIKENQADPEKLWTDLAYKAIKIADDILSARDADPRLKLDTAKWVTERRYGKPNQPIEHKGLSMKDLIKNLGELKLDLVPAGQGLDDICFESDSTETTEH